MRWIITLIGFTFAPVFAGSLEQSGPARIPENSATGASMAAKDSIAVSGIADSIAGPSEIDSSKSISTITLMDTAIQAVQTSVILPEKPTTADLVRKKISGFSSADTSIPEEGNYYYYTWPRKSSRITVPRKENFLLCSSPLTGEFLSGFSDTLGYCLKKRFKIEIVGLDSLAAMLDAKSDCYVMLPMEISGKIIEYNPGMRTVPFLRAFGLLVGIGAGKKVTEYQTSVRLVVIDCKNQRILFNASSEKKAPCKDASVEDEKEKDHVLEKAKHNSFAKAVEDLSRKLKIKAGVEGF